jgi:hypothetical protein
MSKPRTDVLVPWRSIIQPPAEGTVNIMAHRWWVIEDGCVVFFKGVSPQCNHRKAVVADLVELYPGSRLMHLNRVFIPIRPEMEGYDFDPMLIPGARRVERDPES